MFVGRGYCVVVCDVRYVVGWNWDFGILRIVMLGKNGN